MLPQTWDVFCRVVDNLGDAGVCWRLVRRLVQKGGAVRLWIDDLSTLQRLHPEVTSARRQSVEGVEVLDLRQQLAGIVPAEVTVEAFGCGLPDEYVVAMASATRSPIWVVLEYLSAEKWIADHHGLPSPHPRLPLERYFFFPGFTEGTGGLLREPDLFARRDRFTNDDKRAFWQSVGHGPPSREAVTVSLFAYEMAPIDEFLDVWSRSSRPVVAAIPEGRVLPYVLGHFGMTAVPRERVMQRGTLEVRVLPFVPQVRYDELLWSSDINFVRGEDSFVRAQWAGRPFVWQIYPQEGRAHWAKLDAFVDLYCAYADKCVSSAMTGLTQKWNCTAPASVTSAAAWGAFVAEQDSLRTHTRAWAERIAAVGELADNLASFCRDKLK